MITIDGGTGRVILGPVDLVPPQINEDFETILGWADELRRLKVRANADTPEDAAQGARVRRPGNRPLPHRAHVHGRGPAPGRARDDHGRRARRSGARALEQAAAPPAGATSRGSSRRWPGLPVTIRLLDPPLHEFLPPLEEATDEKMRERIRALQESNPMLGTRGCRLGLHVARDLRDAGARDRPRRRRRRERTGEAPLVEIMHPLVGFAEELGRLREMTDRDRGRGGARSSI